MRSTSAQSPPCHDRYDQAGVVYECLFTSSPRQFSPSLYQQLQQEQLTNIEPGRPAGFYPTLLQGNWKGSRGRGWKGEIVCLWKRAMEQDYQSSLKLRAKAGVVVWSVVVYSGTRLISKTTFYGCKAINPLTGSLQAKMKYFISGTSRTSHLKHLWSLFGFTVMYDAV